jgi:uncharacterized protein (TIGR00251 family)
MPNPSPDAFVKAISASADGALLAVVVVPRAGVNAIDGFVEGALRVRIAAPPVDGAANAALVRFLSDLVGIPKGRVRVATGQTSRRKRVLFVGLGPAELGDRLGRRVR